MFLVWEKSIRCFLRSRILRDTWRHMMKVDVKQTDRNRLKKALFQCVWRKVIGSVFFFSLLPAENKSVLSDGPAHRQAQTAEVSVPQTRTLEQSRSKFRSRLGLGLTSLPSLLSRSPPPQTQFCPPHQSYSYKREIQCNQGFPSLSFSLSPSLSVSLSLFKFIYVFLSSP